jgi:hypothetical protein
MQNPNYSEWKATLRNVCEYFILAAGGLIAGIALMSKQKGVLDDWPVPLQTMAAWLFENNWWIVLALAVLGAIAKIVKERLDQSWVWTAVQAIIDRIAKDTFGQTGSAHHHRATLFRYRNYYWLPFPFRSWSWPWGKGRWPCSGWLVPVIRSGHTSQRTRTYFLAPDDADNAEGIAGQIWAGNKELALSTGTVPQVGANQIEMTAYADKTFVKGTWVNEEVSHGKVLAASFRGLPIEGRAGKRWGVLLLDSRDPNAAMNATINIQPYAYCLGKLLERV